MESTVVNLIGAALIATVIWWFWIAKPRVQKLQSDTIDVVVDAGVYSPARIEVAAGKPTVLRFLRKDASPCAETVIFDRLGLATDLPVNETKEVTITPQAPGEYGFACQMQMYKGTLVAK